MPAAELGLGVAGSPARLLVQPDSQIGARPTEADRVEAALVQQPAAFVEAVDVLVPRGDRVRLVEADRVLDVLPELFDVWLAVDRLRPAFVRIADDRPADAAVHHVAQMRFRDLDRARL